MNHFPYIADAIMCERQIDPIQWFAFAIFGGLP